MYFTTVVSFRRMLVAYKSSFTHPLRGGFGIENYSVVFAPKRLKFTKNNLF